MYAAYTKRSKCLFKSSCPTKLLFIKSSASQKQPILANCDLSFYLNVTPIWLILVFIDAITDYHKHRDFRKHKYIIIYHISVDQKSNTSIIWLRSTCQQELCSFLKALGKSPFHCLFQFLDVSCIPQLVAFFLYVEHCITLTLLSSHLPLSTVRKGSLLLTTHVIRLGPPR